jgi:hypothetical protein
MAKKKGIVPQITFKSLLDPIKNIDKRNEKFASLSDEGKRLEIAWEALKLVVNDVARPSNSQHFWRYWDRQLLDTCEVSSSSEELQSEMLKVKSCTVCERGLLTLAKIRIGNNVDPGLGIDNISMGNKYSTREGFYFSSFKDMESEYERSKYNHPLPT